MSWGFSPLISLPPTGAPISKGRKFFCLFYPLIDKVRKNLSGWNLQMIFPRREVNSYKKCAISYARLSSPSFGSPIRVWKIIESIFASFFYGTDPSRKTHWTKWKNMCFPIFEGELVITRITELNIVFDFKLWLKFKSQDSMWAKFLNVKYCSRKHPFNVPPPPMLPKFGKDCLTSSMKPNFTLSGY